MTGPAKSACPSARLAQSIGERLADVPLTVNANICLGVAHFILAEYRLAAEHLEKTVALLDGDLGRQRCGLEIFPSVISRHWLALTCAERGEFDRGIAYGQEAVRLAESLEHPYSASAAYWGLGKVYAARQRHDDAILALERSLALADEWHLKIFSGVVKVSLGSVYAASGRVADGLALLHQGLKDQRPSEAFHSLNTVRLGHAYLLAKRFDDALASAKKAIALAQERSERGTEAWALRLVGEVTGQARSHDSETAEDHYRRALALATELGMRPLVAHCQLGLGKLYGRTGKREQAQKCLTTAVAMYREMDIPYWQEQAEVEAGGLA
jgi:tetratricopeptide (TPR) repeat protein